MAKQSQRAPTRERIAERGHHNLGLPRHIQMGAFDLHWLRVFHACLFANLQLEHQKYVFCLTLASSGQVSAGEEGCYIKSVN